MNICELMLPRGVPHATMNEWSTLFWSPTTEMDVSTVDWMAWSWWWKFLLQGHQKSENRDQIPNWILVQLFLPKEFPPPSPPPLPPITATQPRKKASQQSLCHSLAISQSHFCQVNIVPTLGHSSSRDLRISLCLCKMCHQSWSRSRMLDLRHVPLPIPPLYPI